MRKKIREKLSVQIAKKPGSVVLGAILLFNILFLLFASVVISSLSMDGTEKMNFFEAAFSTITMILDAGCIQFVIADIGRAGVAVSAFCLIVILVGMISFTGAVIGYLTNYISQYIENASAGTRKLQLSDHFVILNWNTRASEIVNDLLYCAGRQIVVVLTESGKQEIEREVEDRLQDTIEKENQQLRDQLKDLPFFRRARRFRRERLKNNVVLIVREGDVFSAKELQSISLKHAKTVIILGKDEKSALGKTAETLRAQNSRGNPLTVKTLMQVSDIVSATSSDDHQRIVVEITDRWTEQLVERIIANKQIEGKCNIVPVKVNLILGQLLSQFSLMPELNLAYRELFSNKGATFYSVPLSELTDEVDFISGYLRSHSRAIPLTATDIGGKPFAFFSAGGEADIQAESSLPDTGFTVDLNHDYHIEDKTVIIIGHNSRCEDIMNGFLSFCSEWHYDDRNHKILQVVVIDDREYLEKVDYYRQYPFVVKTIPATVYDSDIITQAVDQLSLASQEDTIVLILSDDTVSSEAVDANVLSNLVFAQDNIRKREEDPQFDPGSIDIIAEIIDPKHFDVVSTYSVRNVVISNRFISKMITQIGEKDALFDFYSDILSYDEENADQYNSKEIYIKKASGFFNTLPPKCKVSELIRAVFTASSNPALPPKKRNPTLLLGMVKESKVVNALNTVTDAGIGASEVTYDKFFLPSLEQEYIAPQASGVEGSYWPYWKERLELNSPQAQGSGGTNPRHIRYAIENHASAQNCRLRSASRGNARVAWYVTSSGDANYNNATNASRPAPACVIG